MNDNATINANGGKFEGMDRYEARKAIVKELDEMGLLVKVEDYSHNVGVHDRCNTTIEPLIKKQWFVKMDELIQPAAEAVKKGEIRLAPERMEKNTDYPEENNVIPCYQHIRRVKIIQLLRFLRPPDEYGADALRLTLVTGNAPGNDMRFSYEKVEANRNLHVLRHFFYQTVVF